MFWLSRTRIGYHTKHNINHVAKRKNHSTNALPYDKFLPKFLEDFDIEKHNLWGPSDVNIGRWKRTSSNKIGVLVHPWDMSMLHSSLFSKGAKEKLRNYAEYSFSAMAECFADNQVGTIMTSNYAPFAQKMFSNWISYCETNNYKWTYKFNGIKSSTFLASAAFLHSHSDVEERVLQKGNFYICPSALEPFSKFNQENFHFPLSLDLLVWYRLDSDEEMQVRGPDGEVRWESDGESQVIKLQLPFTHFTLMGAIEEGHLESFLGPVKIVDMNFRVAERLRQLTIEDMSCRMGEDIPQNVLMAAYIN